MTTIAEAEERFLKAAKRYCENGGDPTLAGVCLMSAYRLLKEAEGTCCDNEQRNINGGCDNCGDPAL